MKKIIIKKYPNRRLYNTQISSYIALNDILQIVEQEDDFMVIDSKTNEDITRNVLIQVILEQESGGHNILPINFLKQIIRSYHKKHAEFLPHYLEIMMSNFFVNQENVTQISMKDPLKAFETISRNNIKLVEKGIQMFYQPFHVNKNNKEE